MSRASQGDYMAVALDPHDGCQWNPVEHRGALLRDSHFWKTHATVLVGYRNPRSGIQFRLCEACARLPRWNRRSHKPRPITTPKVVPSVRV